MSSSHRVLETDFPLVSPPNPNLGGRPAAVGPNGNSRSGALGRPPGGQYHQRNRSSSGGGLGSLNRQSSAANEAAKSYASKGVTSAGDWQYQSVTATLPVITNNNSEAAAAATSTKQQPLLSSKNQSLGRSGSLRRAYSESSSIGDGGEETDPLCGDDSKAAKVSPQRSHMSSTSDYHSDQTGANQSQNATSLRQRRQRHRKQDDDSMSGCTTCCLGLLVIAAQLLLNGAMGLCLYWVVEFHSKKEDGGMKVFAWKDDPKLEFNLHPVLMIAGFIYFMGQAMLMYRSCRCCRRIWNKLLHAVFHILAIPCIAIGFLAVLDSHNLRTDKEGNPAPIPNFYSLHSWMGLATMGLFALQFVVGFFSFLLLLCCESATASFRASLVPIHSTFGVVTFVLAVATACAGLTEKAFFTLSIAYTKWVPYAFDRGFNGSAALTGLSRLGPEYKHEMFVESLVVNVLGATLVALAVIMPLIVGQPAFRFRGGASKVVTVTHDRYG